MWRFIAFGTLLALGCGGSNVSSTAEAETAYLGLDASIDKAINLGFAGYNAAINGANIPPQMQMGAAAGTITITGTVDRGASSNRSMTLSETLAGYSDDGKITYQSVAPASLKMQLMSVPTGTLSGTLDGYYEMTGKQTGRVTLSVTFDGQLQAGANDAVERVVGKTHIVGTATSSAGTYNIDVEK
jgi:hypothetical protein